MRAVGIVGTVQRIWRYPVKSLGGELLAQVDVEERGLAGDRWFAVRDGDGKLGSGKNTRRFRRMDGLLRLRARYTADGLALLDPAGRPVPDDYLREFLGRDDVELAEENAVPHFDELPVSVLTTATLEWVRDAVPGVPVDERRFRPNLLVRTPPGTPPFAEQDWLGDEATVGGAGLAFVRASERCVMVNQAQPGLAHSPLVLRAIARDNANLLGALATVTRPGRIRVGDALVFG